MRYVLAIAAALAALAGTAQTSRHDAMADSIRAVVAREYFAAPTPPDCPLWADSILPDGRWPDIDYADCSRSRWQLEVHLDRLADMARIGRKDVALRALNHWYEGNYHNDNWWYEKIGMPRRLLAIAYLLDDCVDDRLRDSLASSISIIDSNDFPARPGGDRIQVISNHAKAMLWKRDYEGVAQLLQLIEAEAAPAPMEETMHDAAGGLGVRVAYRPAGRGFQSDMTFHHRGDRVDCTLTYGMEVPEFYRYWQRLLDGTEWAFGSESREFVDRFIEESVRWHLVRDRYTEPAAYNRELGRPVTHPENIRFSGPARLSGARYFPQSAYFAFKRPAYESAVRFHSERNANQEAPHNTEGIRNHFRGDGACHLSVTGEEYLNIWPVFDFLRVPGTTEPLISDSALMTMPVQVLDAPTVFAGAVADSLYGACAFDFISPRFDLRARKSWMFFDEGYVCLGSGITSTLDVPVATTVEQCFSDSGTYLATAGCYTHDGNTYGFLTPGGEASLDWREGTWANCVTGAVQASQQASGEIFVLTIDHGTRPQNAVYAYYVAPGERVAPWFDIVQLTEAVHCVAARDGSLTYIAFFEPASVATPQGRIEVDRPCIAMLRDGALYVADPTHRLAEVKITVENSKGLRINELVALPQGPAAGTTTKIACDL